MTRVKRQYLLLGLAVIAGAAIAIAVGWLIETAGTAIIAGRSDPALRGQSAAQTPASPPLARVSSIPLLAQPRPLPDISFTDGGDRIRSLADFRGKVVLLNIWATWCVPCRTEMPTLDRLQATLGGPEFTVMALSIDRAGERAVEAFYLETDVRNLALYVDSTGKVSGDLGIVGIPTTLLIDADGRELGRLVGPAEWDAPDMVAFLRSHLPRKSGAWTPRSPSRRDGAPLTTSSRIAARGSNLDIPSIGSTIFTATRTGADP